MTFDLTDEETAAPLRELDNLIENDRYEFSGRVRTLKEIRAKIRPEPERKPLPPPPKQYAPPQSWDGACRDCVRDTFYAWLMLATGDSAM